MTATGLRCQLFSPSPARNGRSSSPRMISGTATNRKGVSAAGGRYARTVYNHRKK